MAAIDSTKYKDNNKEPTAELGQLFLQHDLPELTRVALTDKGIRTLALYAAMGATEETAGMNLKKVAGTVWPTDEGDAMIYQARLVATWLDCKERRKVQIEEHVKAMEDPEKVPPIKEPTAALERYRRASPGLLRNIEEGCP
jgi:hypothetical protein